MSTSGQKLIIPSKLHEKGHHKQAGQAGGHMRPGIASTPSKRGPYIVQERMSFEIGLHTRALQLFFSFGSPDRPVGVVCYDQYDT